MAPSGGHAGIFFLESMILVEPTAKATDGHKSSAVPLKLPPLGCLSQHSARKLAADLDHQHVASSLPPSKLRLPSLSRYAVYSASQTEVQEVPNASQEDGDSPMSAHIPRKPHSQKRKTRSLDPRKRPGRELRVADVEQSALAEITCAKDAKLGIVCRGTLDKDLQQAQVSNMQRANRRREVIRQASASQRASARKRGYQRQESQRILMSQMSQLEDEDEDIDTVHEYLTPMGAQLGIRAGSPHWSERSRGSPAVSPEPKAETPREVQQPTCKAPFLQKIKLKSSKDTRMTILSEARQNSKTQAKVRRQSGEQRTEFDALPLSEQEALRNAYRLRFDAHARQSIITPNSHLLDRYHPAAKLAEQESSYLYKCLTDLGLNGKTDLEQKEIKVLCHEAQNHADMDFYKFCFELVPLARSKLMDLQLQSLSEQFAYYDQDGNGFLDRQECLDMFSKTCSNMDRVGLEEVRQEFEVVFNRVKCTDSDIGDGSGHLDLEGFRLLLQLLQEKCECVRRERERIIIEQHALSPEETKAYAEELLILHEAFVLCDSEGTRLLDAPEAFGALLEQGLIPTDAQEREHIEKMVHEALRTSPTPGSLSFRNFLELVRSVRDACRLNARQGLFDYFRDCDKNGDGVLSFAEASVVFEKLGMAPQCRDDQDEMRNLLLRVDVDNSGDLDFHEFTYLIQYITERLRARQRRRENEIAKQLGFSEQQVAELREAFFNLDTQGTGDLGITECRKTLTLLRVDMPAEELKQVLASIDRARKGRIDLIGFYHFMQAITNKNPKALSDFKPFKK